MRRNKYNAKRTTVDGISFASKAEAKRYSELKLLEAAGEISGLECQPKFTFCVNDKPAFFYKADFRYRDQSGAHVVEDVKGVRTPVYRLKKKLIELAYPEITIVEVGI